jgi:ABC-type transport system involved in multi-copper enzyme maturation permease subunit
MLSTLSAEWRKTTYNRWLVAFTVWIFPVGALVFLTFGLLFTILGNEVSREAVRNLNWREQVMGAWQLPTNFFGQLFVVVLAATLFASESGLNTWKNLVPRAKRWQLVVSKFIVILVLMFLAFNAMAMVTGVISILMIQVAGGTMTPSLATLDWGAFLVAYSQSALISLIAVLFSTCFAVLGALAARSAQVGIVLGIGVTLLEQAVPLFLVLASRLLNIPRLVLVHQLTPSYNLQNLNLHFQQGTGFTLFGEWEGAKLTPNSAELSALILAVWVIVLIALSMWLFLRRDVS